MSESLVVMVGFLTVLGLVALGLGFVVLIQHQGRWKARVVAGEAQFESEVETGAARPSESGDGEASERRGDPGTDR